MSAESKEKSVEYEEEKALHITGEDRLYVAEQILLKYNGSAKAYRLAQVGKGAKVSSGEVYIKIFRGVHKPKFPLA